MRRLHAGGWTGSVALVVVTLLAGWGGYGPPEQAEPGETVTASPADSALLPGAQQPGPQFDND